MIPTIENNLLQATFARCAFAHRTSLKRVIKNNGRPPSSSVIMRNDTSARPEQLISDHPGFAGHRYFYPSRRVSINAL
jgi:hypothetical protein